MPAANGTSVDATKYAGSGGYFFVTPSGSFNCGIAYGLAGCMGPTQPEGAEQAACVQQWTIQGMSLEVTSSGPAHFACQNQGIFDVQAKPAVLPYGDSISASGYTCSSFPDGPVCRNNQTGHAFQINRNWQAIS